MFCRSYLIPHISLAFPLANSSFLYLSRLHSFYSSGVYMYQSMFLNCNYDLNIVFSNGELNAIDMKLAGH